MSNPAAVAHEILTTWRDRADTGPKSGQVSMGRIRKQPEIVRLARALSEIELQLSRLDGEGVRVSAYRRQIPDWWRAFLIPSYAESSAIDPDGVITLDHLDEIDACASFLDTYVVTLSDDSTGRLREIIAAARAALAADGDLSEELRRYLHRLLGEIQRALDDDEIGESFDFASAVVRLRVAFGAARGEETARRATWNNLWTSIVSGSVTSVIAQGSTLAIQAIAS